MTFSLCDASIHHRAWARPGSRRVIDLQTSHKRLCERHVTTVPSWIHHSTSSTTKMAIGNASWANQRIQSTKSSYRQFSVLEHFWPSACVFRQIQNRIIFPNQIIRYCVLDGQDSMPHAKSRKMWPKPYQIFQARYSGGCQRYGVSQRSRYWHRPA